MFLVKDDRDVIAYVCKIPPFEGRFSLQECLKREYSIEMIRKLEKNQTIVLDDGTTVLPADIRKDADTKPKNFVGNDFFLGCVASV